MNPIKSPNKWLVIQHLNANCGVCGGVEAHNDFNRALSQLEKPTIYNPLPSGFIIEPTIIIRWEWNPRAGIAELVPVTAHNMLNEEYAR